MLSETTEFISCPKCGSEQQIDFKFCSKCGIRNPSSTQKEEQYEQISQSNLTYLAIYSIVIIVLLLATAFTEESLEFVIFSSIGFAVLDLVFSILQSSVWRLFWKRISLKLILFMMVLGIMTSVLVSISMDQLNLLLFEEKFEYMPVFYTSEHPLFMAILFVCVFPAIFEELAFRGFVFNNLDILLGRKSAIWASAFLFGLVHFSLISLIWLVPFGILLAHFRDRYETLTYGCVLHFTHNATAILIEYYDVW